MGQARGHSLQPIVFGGTLPQSQDAKDATHASR
jgi:hypothetical protein